MVEVFALPQFTQCLFVLEPPPVSLRHYCLLLWARHRKCPLILKVFTAPDNCVKKPLFIMEIYIQSMMAVD
jgi:hypothetical protein